MSQTTERIIQKRVLVDLDRCIECCSCAAACYYSHARMPALGFARTGWALLPMICRQCKAASCVVACPIEAMVRDENGVVRRQLFRCTGCGSCAKACPFGVLPNVLGGVLPGTKSPERMSGHQVPKCDLCQDRTADSDAAPRCVAACPSGALQYADEHEADGLDLTIIGARSTGSLFKRR